MLTLAVLVVRLRLAFYFGSALLVQEIGFANRSPKDVVTMFCQKFISGTKHR